MAMRRIMVILVAALAISACTPAQMQAASDVFAGISRGAAWLSSALDVAETGSGAFFRRHPNVEAEQSVAEAIHKARLAVEALDAVVAAADSLEDPRLEHVRATALHAYDAVRSLVVALGITSAQAPPGGAEAEAPEPRPFELPSRPAMAAALGVEGGS